MFVPVLESVSPVVLTGSYVSRPMSWPEVDVMVLGGPDYAPRDVMGLLRDVGGVDIYAAVLEHGVRMPDEFGSWVRERAHPS